MSGEVFDMLPEEKLLKVHLTLKEPVDGCVGESMWAWFTEDARKAYDDDEEGTDYIGLLQNDSIFIDELSFNCPIKVRMQGDKKPEIIEWGSHLLEEL